MRVIKSRHVSNGHSPYFSISVGIKYWSIGFAIEKWGLRICLIWWHLCF